MSSSNDTSEQSEKQRLWELEEQLEDEQHAHRKTKFTLRDVQEKLKHLSNLYTNAPKDEALIAENQELKNTLRMRDLRLEELQRANSTLHKRNQENSRLIAMLSNEVDKIKSQSSVEELQKEIRDLIEVNKVLIGNLKWEKGGWKTQMEQQSEKIEEAEQTIRDLRQEYSDLEVATAEAMNALECVKDYETRLEEHWDEVDRLRITKRGAVECCQHWASECEQMIGRLIEFLEERQSDGDAEEVRKLREVRKKTCADYDWWSDYKYVTTTLSDVFQAIHDMRSTPVSKKWLVYNRGSLIELKEMFDEYSRKVKKGTEGREWVDEEISSKGFETWETLIREAEEMINEQLCS